MFPDQTLAATFNIDENKVMEIRANLPKNPALALAQSECFKRCGLAMPPSNSKPVLY